MVVRGGRYELLGAVASGGMASVHLARALGLGGFERFVAVKVMHQSIAEEADFVAMFLDEARLAARIRHPNVVGTLDVQQDEHGLFLVMEYVDGPSLQGVTRALGKSGVDLPLDIALRIFLDALAGLHAAHELRGPDGELLNLVHRDVSPHNILIGVDGVAQITDFGVARAESRLQSTKSGVVKGKIAYMAPEQILADPIDRRADVFAAGAVLWELCTQKRRIQGDNEAAMMRLILAGQKESPRDVNPSVPQAISDACMRALSLAPDDRFATAADFAEALEQAAQADAIRIASARGLSAFIKGLELKRPSLQELAASVKQGTPSRPTNATNRSVVAQGALSPVMDVRIESTNAALVTHGSLGVPSRKPQRLRWAAIGGACLLAGGAIYLITLGPLKVSWRGSGASASAAPVSAIAPTSEPQPASTPVPIVSPVTTAEPVATKPTASATATASPAPSATSAPRAPVRVDGRTPAQDQNPAGFRPKDL